MGKSSVWSDDLERRKKELRKAWNKAGRKGRGQDQDQEKYKAIHRALLKDYNRAQAELREKCKKRFFEEADSVSAYESMRNRKDWKFAERVAKRGKIKFAIHKFHSFKSAGLDEIFPALLKEGIELLV